MRFDEEIKAFSTEAKSIVSMQEGHNSSVYSFEVGDRKLIFKRNNLWPTAESESFFLKMLEKTNIVPKLYLVNFEQKYQVMDFIPGEVQWKEYPLENQLLLFKNLGELVSQIHQINLGNGAGEYRLGFPEFKSNFEFMQDRLNWIRSSPTLIEYIPDLNSMIDFLEDYFLYNLDKEIVLTHGDLYLQNTLHSNDKIHAIIDPGEFRGFSKYIDIGTIHASQAKYKDGDKHFLSFIEGYNQLLDFGLVNAFSAFWDLRSYTRLLEEHPGRFNDWYSKTYEFLLERLKFIGYR